MSVNSQTSIDLDCKTTPLLMSPTNSGNTQTYTSPNQPSSGGHPELSATTASTFHGLAQSSHSGVTPDSDPLLSDESSIDQAKINLLRLLVTKYTIAFPHRPIVLHPRKDDGDVVLVTGTTGMFGCHILAQLSLDPSVRLVYALNRASTGLVERHLESIKSQGLLAECLTSPKFRIIGTDISQPNLGLSPELYEEIRDSVTHIIHNAWPVSFKLPLTSFLPVLQATRNLVDLALSSRCLESPSIMFVSSVSVFRRPYKLPLAPEVAINDPATCVGWGYSESKWVAESTLLAAAEETGLRVNIVRVGQLCGAKNGHWNEKEALSAIVKSAYSVHCLPDVPGLGLVSWIPAYEAAKALIEMRDSTEQVLHLANPHPQPWRTFFDPLSHELDVPLVPYDTWVSALEADINDPSMPLLDHLKRNPALRLLNWFQHVDMDEEKEPLGLIPPSAIKASRVVPWLNDVEIGENMVMRWLGAWRETGFLPSASHDKGQKVVPKL